MKKIMILFAALVSAASMMANTVYFVNKAGWTAPNCYAWTGGTNNGTWPGVAMTKENYRLAGADVYSYTTTETYANCIFNGGGNQTADLTWTEGKYYDGTGWKTRAELENGGTSGGDDPVTPPSGGLNPRYYYLGHIDGVDIQPDDQNYNNRFYGGTASLTVVENAYLFALYQEDGVPGVQYMTTAYVDGPTHATLSVNGGGSYQKLHVGPGTYTLYLYDNGDGTLELSTQAMAGKTLCDPDGETTSLKSVDAVGKTRKCIENGRMVILRDGIRYNAVGARL